MNRDEIAAKIAELEKKIQIDKMQETSSPHTSDSTSNSGNDRYALCLGGGGGKGAYQLGVYRALTEYGLMKKVDAISGTSIGAINAVLFACNDPDSCDDAWRQIHFETVFDVDSDLLFNDKLGFLSRKEMLILMGSYLDYDKLSSGIPKIYATIAECVQDEPKNAEYIDLSGKNKEEINTVVMASSTLPLLYESGGSEECTICGRKQDDMKNSITFNYEPMVEEMKTKEYVIEIKDVLMKYIKDIDASLRMQLLEIMESGINYEKTRGSMKDSVIEKVENLFLGL